MILFWLRSIVRWSCSVYMVFLQCYSGGDLYFKILDYASSIGGVLAVGLHFCEVTNDDLCAYDNIRDSGNTESELAIF